MRMKAGHLAEKSVRQMNHKMGMKPVERDEVWETLVQQMQYTVAHAEVRGVAITEILIGDIEATIGVAVVADIDIEDEGMATMHYLTNQGIPTPTLLNAHHIWMKSICPKEAKVGVADAVGEAALTRAVGAQGSHRVPLVYRYRTTSNP